MAGREAYACPAQGTAQDTGAGAQAHLAAGSPALPTHSGHRVTAGPQPEADTLLSHRPAVVGLSVCVLRKKGGGDSGKAGFPPALAFC